MAKTLISFGPDSVCYTSPDGTLSVDWFELGRVALGGGVATMVAVHVRDDGAYAITATDGQEETHHLDMRQAEFVEILVQLGEDVKVN